MEYEQTKCLVHVLCFTDSGMSTCGREQPTRINKQTYLTRMAIIMPPSPQHTHTHLPSASTTYVSCLHEFTLFPPSIPHSLFFIPPPFLTHTIFSFSVSLHLSQAFFFLSLSPYGSFLFVCICKPQRLSIIILFLFFFSPHFFSSLLIILSFFFLNIATNQLAFALFLMFSPRSREKHALLTQGGG